VGVREYIITPLLYAVSIGTQLFAKPQTHPQWTGPILFDQGARNLLEFGSRSARRNASTVSDSFMIASIGYSYVVDDLLVTWVGRENPDVAWQMIVINTQAYGLTLALNTLTKRIAGRERPYGEGCRSDPNSDLDCNNSTRYQSFYSGHSAMTATSAGLICAHHTQLQLYKNGVADASACLAGVLLTAATGVLRITSDRHWASDVLTGHLMGYVSGYLLPTLLYYKNFHIGAPRPEQEAPAKPKVVAILPQLTANSLGVDAIGVF
jgi:membrane-associated phospholipid phosphatase